MAVIPVDCLIKDTKVSTDNGDDTLFAMDIICLVQALLEREWKVVFKTQDTSDQVLENIKQYLNLSTLETIKVNLKYKHIRHRNDLSSRRTTISLNRRRYVWVLTKMSSFLDYAEYYQSWSGIISYRCQWKACPIHGSYISL